MDVVAVVPLHSLLVIWCIPTWSASGTEKVSWVKFIGHRASAHLLIWVPEMLIEAIDYGTKLGYCGEWRSQEPGMWVWEPRKFKWKAGSASAMSGTHVNPRQKI